eukprot:TRINITY_DN10078_c0_g2_i3.p1 TRINITY_DN10078_c0_g2~~TRINITY_DN10078_c0_g2_i3.p1  ORF type:complete len:446 (-),score=50.31 TRINITY_DN10078_c0_g2_i3:199-1467(-)
MAPRCLNALFVTSICISKLIGASRLHDEAEAVASVEDDRDRFNEGQIAELTDGMDVPESRHERMQDREWERIRQAKAEQANRQGTRDGISPVLFQLLGDNAEKQHSGTMHYDDGNRLNDTMVPDGLVKTRNPGLTDQYFRTLGFVFLRIQKTGTTTVSVIASEQYKRMGENACDVFLHLDWNYVSQLVARDPKRVIITMLRNPVIRVISEGNFLRADPSYARQLQWDYTPDMYTRLLEWIRVNGTMADFANLPLNPANNRQVRYILGFGRPAQLTCWDHCDEFWTEFANAGGAPPGLDAINDAATVGGAQVLDVVKHRLEHEIDFFGVTECFESSLNIASKVLQWDPEVTKPFLDDKMRQSSTDYDDVTTAGYQEIKDKNALDAGMIAGAIDLLASRAQSLNIIFRCEDPNVKTSTEKLTML